MRFSLRNLFLIIALLALGCAGLMYRNRWWLMGITTLALTVFIAAALMAIVRHGRQRAVLCGFSIVGFSYYYLSSATAVGGRLPTTVALAAAARSQGIGVRFLQSLDPFGAGDEGKPTLEEYIQQTAFFGPDDISTFVLIGHCLWSLLFATLAAWFVGRMYDRHNSPMKATL